MPEPKQWTVMVWMAGDNDLEDFALGDLRELKKVGSTTDVDVVAQIDLLRDDHTRRYHVRRGTTVEQDQVQDLGETNCGDPAVAADFFTWAIQHYPACHYLAVLWNHGSGIDETDVYRRARTLGITVERRAAPSADRVPRARVRTIASRRFSRSLFSTTVAAAISNRAIAYDDTARYFLDNLELKRVLATVKQRTGHALDIVGFDACLMSMVEIAYELRPYAKLLVGSQEVEPGDGWPYDQVLAALTAKPGMTPEELGTAIVDRYVASYRRGAVTLSLLDSRHTVSVVKTADAFAGALITAMKPPVEYAAVMRSVNAAQHFEVRDFVDLCDFSDQVRRRSKSTRVKAAAESTINAVCDGAAGLVRRERHKGEAVGRSHGVSVYFPRGDVTVAYGRLQFARRTRWDEFLAAMQ
jgi:hypothetical protein